jgi:hypothetical protein
MRFHRPHDLSVRARGRAADTIDILLRSSLAAPGRRRLPPLVRRDVAEAVEHDLQAVRACLLDEDVAVHAEAAYRLEAFLNDGAESPLYQDDPRRAAAEAHTLAELIAA